MIKIPITAGFPDTVALIRASNCSLVVMETIFSWDVQDKEVRTTEMVRATKECDWSKRSEMQQTKNKNGDIISKLKWSSRKKVLLSTAEI